MTCVPYDFDKEMTLKRVKKYLRRPDEDKVSFSTGIDIVKPNAIYVFRVFAETKNPYWRFDGYQWSSLRSSLKPNRNPKYNLHQSQLLVNGNPVEFMRFEYYPLGCKVKPPNNWKYPNVIVQYRGSFNLEEYVSAPHGNRKPTPQKSCEVLRREILGEKTPEKTPANLSDVNAATIRKQCVARKKTGGGGCLKRLRTNEEQCDTNQDVSTTREEIDNYDSSQYFTPDVEVPSASVESTVSPEQTSIVEENDTGGLEEETPAQSTKPPGFTRNNPIVRINLMDKLKSNKKPSEAYNETVSECIARGSDLQLTPRNRKQVYNIQYQLSKENKHDDIYEVYSFACEHPSVVIGFELIPDVVLVVTHPEITKYLDSLRRRHYPITLHYDTTFDVGPFFTSILSFRNIIFKNHPVTPLAVMFHESTKEHCHNAFFRTLNENGLLMDFQGVLVTDREKSITNAVRLHCPNAKHVYCWNHLRRNVGDWAKKRISSEAASKYKKDVFELLQAESTNDFELRYTGFAVSWNERFQQYFNQHIKNDLLQSFRPVLEKYGVYTDISGITNNAAESANASFKNPLKVKTASFFQALSSWYFHQNFKLQEIWLGVKNRGDYELCESVNLEGIYIPENIKDLVDQNMISDLVHDGRLPKSVRCRESSFASVNQRTTLRGIASLIVEREQITWNIKQKSFVVTGLMEKQYLVTLRPLKCTCLRGIGCEHIMAVQLGTNLGVDVLKTNCSVGSRYRQKIKKATGSKKGQGNKRAIRLPARKSIEITSTRSGDTTMNSAAPLETTHYNSVLSVPNENEISILNTDSEKEICLAQPTAHKLPTVTNKNFSRPFLHLPTGNISLGEIKTIQSRHSRSEMKLLSQSFKCSENSVDWLVDSIIDGFFLKILDISLPETVSLTSQEFSFLLREETDECVFAKEAKGNDYHDWGTIENIMIPFNYHESHWILLVLWPKKKQIDVLDPQKSFTLPAKIKLTLQQTFNPKFSYLKTDDWNVVYPEVPRSFGQNALQCGPFICFYAEAIAKKYSLQKLPEISAYRDHILATLIGNCNPLQDKRFKKCHRCELIVTSEFKCDFCSSKIHKDCADTLIIRGRTYNVCK